ncbi:MAG: DUF4982 domain-containing protein [Bacteroidota bacterium]|nr:DUF4982 domain-containing protein [Bacteroidota bacterium]
MRFTHHLLLLSALTFSTGVAAKNNVQASPSTQQLFDFGWRFAERDISGAERPEYNDRTWQQVDLPHDWDIHHAPDVKAPMGNDGGYYPGGIGWYRKQFVTPKASRTVLRFDGIYQHSTVWVNGQRAATHAYGYTPFSVDITPMLRKTGTNVVAVRVDNSQQPNCRWYSGSGIYRHVWLETSGEVYVKQHGVVVTTPQANAESAEVCVSVSVKNASNETRNLNLGLDIASIPMPNATNARNVSGNRQAENSAKSRQSGATNTGNVLRQPVTQQFTLVPGEERTIDLNTTIDHPQLWSPDSPARYMARVEVSEGKELLDRKVEKFGVRTMTYSATDGFRLNGKSMKINGACMHHDTGLLGAAAFDDAERHKVALMKEAGFNLIRTSHNPTTTAMLDACDSLGMLVIGEAFDGWYTQKTKYDYHTVIDSCYREDLQAMVTRDRNHPSIIAWSIGNEVIERRDLQVVLTAKNMKREVLRWDTTRPVTEALCTWNSDWEVYDPHADVLDIVGYNYMMHKHASDHQRAPERIMWQTESYPRDAFLNWNRTSSYPYIIGDVVWTGLDYLGESGIGRSYYEGEPPGEHYQRAQFPWHGAYCGDVDITGWRKPISHYRDMLWNPDTTPLVYMAVKEPNGYHGVIHETQWSVYPTWESWNWPGHEGKSIDVEVYSHAPAVRVYLNDKVVAERQLNKDTVFKDVIPIQYEPGVLRCVALDANGNETQSCTLETSGAPAALLLTTDRTVMQANGQDLAYVTIEVVDSHGRLVPDAKVAATVNVSGAGSLAAAGSANLQDLEPLTSPRVTTWQGRAQAVIRASRKAGQVTVSVTSELPKSTLVLKTTR